MKHDTRTPEGRTSPADDARAAHGRHGRTESQDPQAAAQRARDTDDDAGHEVRVRSNYQTPLGDVAAAADAQARSEPGGAS